MPALLQTAMFAFAHERMIMSARRRYGPVFRVKYIGAPAEVYVATAELAEQVYRVDAGGGRAGTVRERFLGPAVGRHSLLCLDGDPWWRHRRLLSPPLHGRAVAKWSEQIGQIAAAEIETWPRNEPFALRARMQDITLEVILRLVFGIRDAERLARLRKLLPAFIDVGGSGLLLLLPPELRARMERSRLLRRFRSLPTTRFIEIRDAVDAIIYDEIARRRSAPGDGASDVLSLLLAARDDEGRAMSDEELRDELITLLEAGHETTATGLAWAFERLTRAPKVLARLREELAAGDETYLEAVVKEALRSRPVVYEAPRLLDAPLRLGDYELPAGCYAAPSILLIHRDPDVYPEPQEFRPERFLGDDAARAHKAWMPFGGGRRYCVGAQLAQLEMKVIIREVLQRLNLTAADPAPEPARIKHVTLVPARLTRVIATESDHLTAVR